MYCDSIEKRILEKKPHNEIARMIYLSFPTSVFIGNEERKFEIFNEISSFFNIPFMNIQVVGSAKTGFSFFKKTDFNSTNSDLDIAIIDSNLFISYTDIVFKLTNGYSNRANFPLFDGKSTYNQYINCVSKGYFRPDLMPHGKTKINWLKFFGKLSSKNKDLFKSINAGIYLSQTFFEYKQKSNINEYILNKAI